MKKNLFALFLLVFVVKLAVAQDSGPGFKRFGVRAGANFSHINFAKGVPPPTVPITTTWKAGVNIGFLMVVPISGDLYFQSEYAYSQMGGDVKSANTTYKLDYFSIPLFLKYQLHEKISLMAGPQFDLLISAKKQVGAASTNITHDTEERSFSATGAVDYQITSSFSVSARYMYALNHVGIGQRSDIQEFKYETAQLMACFRF